MKCLEDIHWCYISLGEKRDDEDTGSPGKHHIYSTSQNLTPESTSFIQTSKRREDTTEPRERGGKKYILKEVTSS